MSVNRLLANLAQSLDSSSVGSFLSGDSADRFQTLQWTDVSGRPTVADSATTTSIIDSAYVQTRVTTYSVGLDSATTIALLDSDYIRSKVTNDVGFFIYHYDTTPGQTLLDSSNEANNNAISYTKDYVMVFKNGVLLDSAAGDYTATSGNTVVLGTGADSGEVVTVVKWAPGSSSSGAAATWYGDRAIVHTYSTIIQLEYYDITTTGNAANFGGGITAQRYAAACSNGTYGCIMGGAVGSTQYNQIEYVTISTTGDASDFGDLTQTCVQPSGTGDGTYGIRFGGEVGSPAVNNIDYFTMASPSNAVDFGDLTASSAYSAACSDGTYGVRMGGTTNSNIMDYVTTASPGNATDFGDLLDTNSERGTGFQDENGRGGRGSGELSSDDLIQYIQIDTTSNATSFGNLTAGRNRLSSSCNATRATFAGGSTTNTIDYITVQTTGNATDFGDLLGSYYGNTGTAGSPS